jgi:hypothetical protein
VIHEISGPKEIYMRRVFFFFTPVIFILFAASNSFADRAPHGIVGFRLGDDISSCANLVHMDTALPIRHREYLHEVETRELEGFKSGIIAFGNCANLGRIIRIKLKYAYPGKRFFNELLERFKKRFGEPDEWKGDAFQAIIAWKWSFIDEENNSISMVLQHSVDEEQKYGNSLKLTNKTLMEKERLCYKKKHPDSSTGKISEPIPRKRRLKDEDFQRFVPK